MESGKQELYRMVFKEYPDVMDVKQVSAALDVSTKMVYRLIRDGAISSLKIGREFRIPKVAIMRYLNVFGSAGKEPAQTMTQ
jgi:excisionase family DNA binding protein